MITLFQFPPMWGLPNVSVFCMKVETFLRMAGITYKTKSMRNPGRAPKGKLPFIIDGDTTVADSGLIVEYLTTKYGHDLDAPLSAEQRAASLALRRLMEEHLYWCVLYERWIVDEYWEISKRAYFAGVPAPLFWIVPAIVRRGLRRQMHGHGLGRHSRAEIEALGRADIAALSGWLGDKTYFMGDVPTSLDATAYAFVANLLWVPLDTALTRAARERRNLVAYGERMKARYYGEGGK